MIIGYSEVSLAILGLCAIIISLLALKRQPRLPTEIQTTVKNLVDDFNAHVKSNETTFDELSTAINELTSDGKLQASELKLQIASFKLANTEGQTDIKVQIAKLATQVTYMQQDIAQKH